MSFVNDEAFQERQRFATAVALGQGYDGVYTTDGYTFINYKNTPDEINAGLGIVPPTGGLVTLTPEGGSVYTPSPAPPESYPTEAVIIPTPIVYNPPPTVTTITPPTVTPVPVNLTPPGVNGVVTGGNLEGFGEVLGVGLLVLASKAIGRTRGRKSRAKRMKRG